MRYRRSDTVAFRQLGSECLLVPIRTDPSQPMAVFRLNEVGAFLWQALDAPATVEELGRRLADEFEVTAAQAKRDSAAFLELLRGKQLIEQVRT